MVAAEVLGRAVDDHVDAERERSLVDGRSEGVVHDGRDAARARQLREGAEVGETHQRVGGRLGVDELRVGAERGGELLGPGLVNVCDLDAEARQHALHQTPRVPA